MVLLSAMLTFLLLKGKLYMISNCETNLKASCLESEYDKIKHFTRKYRLILDKPF